MGSAGSSPRLPRSRITAGCHTCELNAEGDALPLSERLYLDEFWRVAHGWSSLPGWLVVALRRHAEALAELTADEAAALGPILHAASIALERTVACEKTYVILFAEHPRYPHVHLHVVPRMAWFVDGDLSTAVFRFMNVPEEQQVTVDERERIALEIGETMRSLIG